MSNRIVHCRIIDGQTMYRIWSDNMRCYLTKPMTRNQVIRWLETADVLFLVTSLTTQAIEKSVDRASIEGSSVVRTGEYNTKGPWETNKVENRNISPASPIESFSREEAIGLARAIQVIRDSLPAMETTLFHLQKKFATESEE